MSPASIALSCAWSHYCGLKIYQVINLQSIGLASLIIVFRVNTTSMHRFYQDLSILELKNTRAQNQNCLLVAACSATAHNISCQQSISLTPGRTVGSSPAWGLPCNIPAASHKAHQLIPQPHLAPCTQSDELLHPLKENLISSVSWRLCVAKIWLPDTSHEMP